MWGQSTTDRPICSCAAAFCVCRCHLRQASAGECCLRVAEAHSQRLNQPADESRLLERAAGGLVIDGLSPGVALHADAAPASPAVAKLGDNSRVAVVHQLPIAQSGLPSDQRRRVIVKRNKEGVPSAAKTSNASSSSFSIRGETTRSTYLAEVCGGASVVRPQPVSECKGKPILSSPTRTPQLASNQSLQVNAETPVPNEYQGGLGTRVAQGWDIPVNQYPTGKLQDLLPGGNDTFAGSAKQPLQKNASEMVSPGINGSMSGTHGQKMSSVLDPQVPIPAKKGKMSSRKSPGTFHSAGKMSHPPNPSDIPKEKLPLSKFQATTSVTVSRSAISPEPQKISNAPATMLHQKMPANLSPAELQVNGGNLCFLAAMTDHEGPAAVPEPASCHVMENGVSDASEYIDLPMSAPAPLLYMPLTVNRTAYRALLDSGASDNFISLNVARELNLPLHPLKDPLRMQVANGVICMVDQSTRPYLVIGGLKIRLFLKVVDSPIPVILGYPFFNHFMPLVNWRTRVVTIFHNETRYEIQAYPTLYANAIFGPPDPSPVFLIRPAPPENSPKPARGGTISPVKLTPVLPIVDLADAAPEYLPEEQEKIVNQAQYNWNGKKGGRKPKIGPKYFLPKQIDHSICGPPVKTNPVPPAIQAVVDKYLHVFPPALPKGLPPSRETDHKIEIKEGARPPAQQIRRMSQPHLEELTRQIPMYMDYGWVRRSISPYGANVTFAAKKDGSKRLCVDYRQLNLITVADKYPLPRLDAMMDRFSKAQYFTKMDLSQGFHQIRIAPGDEHKTAFQCALGSFEWLVVPFGLKNGPATFQRTMDLVLQPARSFAVVYVDDIVIFSMTLKDHLRHLEIVLDLLSENQLYGKLSKCSFAQPEMEFVGYICGQGGIRPMPMKLQTIHEWPQPGNPRDIRQFLGVCGFYHQFIPSYATIASPLTNLLHIKRKWTWGEVENEAFERMKKAMLTYPLLTYPDLNQPFILYTDASDTGTGAMLCQKDDLDQLRLITCTSRKLNIHEINYPTHEKELLALVDALKKWRHYCLGTTTHVFTDNTTLRYLQTMPRPSARQIRWLQFLAEYDLVITHIPGRTNTVADILSRLHPSDPNAPTAIPFPPSIKMLPSGAETPAQLNAFSGGEPPSTSSILPFFLAPALAQEDDWTEDYLADPHIFQEHYDPITRKMKLTSRAKFKYGRLWQGAQILVPENRIQDIIATHHDSIVAGHWGLHKTVSMIRRRFDFPKMRKRVQEHISSCHICQISKSDHHGNRALMEEISIPTMRWNELGADHIIGMPPVVDPHGIHPYDSVWVVVDKATRMVHLIPSSTHANAMDMADQFIKKVVKYHGIPRSITTDRGSMFTSHFWQRFMSMLNIKWRPTVAYHPQANGQTERMNATIKQLLINLHTQRYNWVEMLDYVEMAINNAPLVSTDYSPYFLNYGFHPTFFTDLPEYQGPMRRLQEAPRQYLQRMNMHWRLIAKIFKAEKDKMIARTNSKRKLHQFKVGDQVLLKNRRPHAQLAAPGPLQPKAVGPFRITKAITESSFELDLPKYAAQRMHNAFNAQDLIPYVQRIPTGEAEPRPADESSASVPVAVQPAALNSAPPVNGPAPGGEAASRSTRFPADPSEIYGSAGRHSHDHDEDKPLETKDTRVPRRPPPTTSISDADFKVLNRRLVQNWQEQAENQQMLQHDQNASPVHVRYLSSAGSSRERGPIPSSRRPQTRSQTRHVSWAPDLLQVWRYHSREPYQEEFRLTPPTNFFSQQIVQDDPEVPFVCSVLAYDHLHPGANTRFAPRLPRPGPFDLNAVTWAPTLTQVREYTPIPVTLDPDYRAPLCPDDDPEVPLTGWLPSTCCGAPSRLRKSVTWAPRIQEVREFDWMPEVLDPDYQTTLLPEDDLEVIFEVAEPHLPVTDLPVFGENEVVRLDPARFQEACFRLKVQPTIDLFATSENAQLPRFITPTADPAAVTSNAFTYQWNQELGYANPPWSLIPQVLAKVRQDACQLVIVVPNWPSAAWFNLLSAMTTRRHLLKGPIYLDNQGKLRPTPSWTTLAALLDGSILAPSRGPALPRVGNTETGTREDTPVITSLNPEPLPVPSPTTRRPSCLRKIWSTFQNQFADLFTRTPSLSLP